MRMRELLGAGLPLLVLLGGLAPAARADMVLSEVIVDLQSPKEVRRDIEVWNSGAEVLYVEVQVSQILEPAGDESKRAKLSDPRSAGLLASPNRLAIQPNQRKRVRIVARKPAMDGDLVYRVAFIPRENPVRSQEEMAFKVLVGYEVLVIVRPPGGKPDLSVARHGQVLQFENRGNSSILVRKLEQCPGGATECTEIAGNRLYAGERWETTLPHPGPVRVFESYRTENRVKRY